MAALLTSEIEDSNKRDIMVELPRERDPASPEFNALKRELGQLVMEEQQRHHHDELRMAAVD